MLLDANGPAVLHLWDGLGDAVPACVQMKSNLFKFQIRF